MWIIFTDFFQRFLMDQSLKMLLEAMEGVLHESIYMPFYIENIETSSYVLTGTHIQNAFIYLYGVLLVLLAAKLLWKGFKVYILWMDGESEVSPVELVKNTVFALLTAIAFPPIYDIVVAVVQELSKAILNAFSLPEADLDLGLEIAVEALNTSPEMGLSMLIMMVVYTIVLMMVLFQALGRGVELLVFRLGVPLAAVGLVDSDGGMWKPYIQCLFRLMITGLVQYFLIALGLRVIADLTFMNLVLGIALEVAAFKAPKLLSQFMLSSGGGGGGKIYTLAMAAKSFVGA